MALVYTPKSNPKKKCPVFSLKALDGKIYHSNKIKEDILAIMFICNHCPYVRLVEGRLLRLVDDFKKKSVRFVGICSNDAETYPEDSFENLKKRAKQKKYNFLYLHDPTQKSARDFEAVCTPDFFIYDKKRRQVWRGRLDDSLESEKKVKKQEMKLAIESLLKGQKPSIEEPSFGCSIKWI